MNKMNGEDLLLTDIRVPSDFNINWGQVAKFAVFAIIVALLSDVNSAQGGLYWVAKISIASLLVISIFSPVRIGLIIFFILLIVGQDITQAPSEMFFWGPIATSSIWSFNIGPIRPSWIIAVSCIIHIAKVAWLQTNNTVKLALVWFATVPILTGFMYSGSTKEIAIIEVPVDLKFGIMLLLSIILFYSLLAKYPQYLATLVAVFVGSLLARHSIDFIYWLMRYGPLLSVTTPRASVDSAKGGVIFLLLYSIYLTIVQKKFISGLIIGIVSVLLIVVFATRGLWVTAFLGCILLLFILGIRRGLIAVPIVAIVVLSGIQLVEKIQPQTSEFVSKRAETFTLGTVGKNYLESLDPIRYRQIFNTFDTSFRRGALLWGSGYGSYYTDDAIPFPVELIGAFPFYSRTTGKFYRAHDYFLHVLFKHGLIGLIIITALWLVPGWQCYKLARADRTLMSGTLACLVAFLITGFNQLFWSGKGLFLNGFVIAVLFSVADQYRQLHLYALEEEPDTLSSVGEDE